MVLLTDSTVVNPGATDGYVAAIRRDVSDLELALWVVALGALVMDVALTIYGLSIGLVERNPVVRGALESYGPVILVLAKAVAVAVALAFRVTWPRYAVFPPLALAVPWTLAAGVNLVVIASA